MPVLCTLPSRTVAAFSLMPISRTSNCRVLNEKGRGAGDHSEIADPRQRVEQFLSQAVAKILVLRSGAQVRKRQNCNGGGRVGAWGWLTLFNHISDEAIAVFLHSPDITGSAGSVADGMPDVPDLPSQGIVCDKRTLPDLIKQFLLFCHAVTVLDQIYQKVERPRLKHHRLAASAREQGAVPPRHRRSDRSSIVGQTGPSQGLRLESRAHTTITEQSHLHHYRGHSVRLYPHRQESQRLHSRLRWIAAGPVGRNAVS